MTPEASPPVTDAPEAPTPSKQPENNSSVPPAPLAIPPETDAEIKTRLEYALAGRYATVRLRGQTLVFQKWGLRKNLAMGAKVIKMVTSIQQIVGGKVDTLNDVGVFSQVLSYVANDVIEILAGSVAEGKSFKNEVEAEAWLDDNAELTDLFDLGYIVWEMNLKERGLGKLMGDVGVLAGKVTSLSMSSSKN